MKIERKDFIEIICSLIKKAVISSPEEIKIALKECLSKEEGIAYYQIELMIENLKVAEENEIPLCQDTGVPIFFVEMGRKFPLGFNLDKAIKEAVARATEEIPLRRNVVHPITRKYIGKNDNTGLGFPFIWFTLIEGDELNITFLPKGGGSENMSRLRMMDSVSKIKDIKSFIIDTAVEFLGKPCPPYIMGVGIGGSSDLAMHLAKKATLRSIKKRNPDPPISKLEEELKEEINSLGIGPMGRGGRSTVLAVNIEIMGVHTSVYPIAITNQCWPARKAKVKITSNGEVKFEN